MSRREAVVQGEVHTSESDRLALVDRDLEDCDALLVEGRSRTLVVRELTLGYAGFLMGYVTLMWVQAAVDRLRRRLSGHTPLRELAEHAGVDYHDRIDADTHTAYEMCPDSLKYVFGGLLVVVLCVGILVGVNRLVVATLALSLPHLYTSLCILAVKATGDRRARHMAERITHIADERSYERVAVLCGTAHREAIGEALEERDWSVRTYGSRHPLGRLFG